jgi:hypothetical protein
LLVADIVGAVDRVAAVHIRAGLAGSVDASLRPVAVLAVVAIGVAGARLAGLAAVLRMEGLALGTARVVGLVLAQLGFFVAAVDGAGDPVVAVAADRRSAFGAGREQKS